ncbi:MAG TPA: hypothetical protein VG944_16400 [Fimbriimonas sp.]|nr:hypothetical protein [Fimbriimonas sp.]
MTRFAATGPDSELPPDDDPESKELGLNEELNLAGFQKRPLICSNATVSRIATTPEAWGGPNMGRKNPGAPESS